MKIFWHLLNLIDLLLSSSNLLTRQFISICLSIFSFFSAMIESFIYYLNNNLSQVISEKLTVQSITQTRESFPRKENYFLIENSLRQKPQFSFYSHTYIYKMSIKLFSRVFQCEESKHFSRKITITISHKSSSYQNFSFSFFFSLFFLTRSLRSFLRKMWSFCFNFHSFVGENWRKLC